MHISVDILASMYGKTTLRHRTTSLLPQPPKRSWSDLEPYKQFGYRKVAMYRAKSGAKRIFICTDTHDTQKQTSARESLGRLPDATSGMTILVDSAVYLSKNRSLISWKANA